MAAVKILFVSPFRKGGLRGIFQYSFKIIPPDPPLKKGWGNFRPPFPKGKVEVLESIDSGCKQHEFHIH